MHKILCKLGFHNFEYWNDKKYLKYNMIQRMRKCSVCKKKERLHSVIHGHECWLVHWPKPKSRKEIKELIK